MTTAEPPGARYAVPGSVRLTADDVGARVVVRHRLAEGGSTDLLGDLVQWDLEVVVRDGSGLAHAVLRTDVVAAKRVPPPPVRR